MKINYPGWRREPVGLARNKGQINSETHSQLRYIFVSIRIVPNKPHCRRNARVVTH